MIIHKKEPENNELISNIDDFNDAKDLYIGRAILDTEPYTEGVIEGDKETIQQQDYVSLNIHACIHCGYVYSSYIE